MKKHRSKEPALAQLTIVYHSQSGRNQTLALQLRDAALSAVAECDNAIYVVLLRAAEACTDDFVASDLLVLVMPENFGNLAGGIKDLFDRVFYPAERAGATAKPYMLVLDTGNSGDGAIARAESIFQGMAAKPVQAPLVLYGEPDEQAIAQVRELAQGLVCGLDMGLF